MQEQRKDDSFDANHQARKPKNESARNHKEDD